MQDPLTARLQTLTFDDAHALRLGPTGRRSPGCMTAMEVVSLLAGEPPSEYPARVSTVLAAVVSSFSDEISDARRQALSPHLAALVDTADYGDDQRRGWMCVDWLVRTDLPSWLEFAGAADVAVNLRAMPEIRSVDELVAAKPQIDAVDTLDREPGGRRRSAFSRRSRQCAECSSVVAETCCGAAPTAAWEGVCAAAINGGWFAAVTPLKRARAGARAAAYEALLSASLEGARHRGDAPGERKPDPATTRALRRTAAELDTSLLDLLSRMAALRGDTDPLVGAG